LRTAQFPDIIIAADVISGAARVIRPVANLDGAAGILDEGSV
jgi:hypothetical protein